MSSINHFFGSFKFSIHCRVCWPFVIAIKNIKNARNGKIIFQVSKIRFRAVESVSIDEDDGGGGSGGDGGNSGKSNFLILLLI